jgi:RNA polymerase sigma-70 factor (ECF subfamily)
VLKFDALSPAREELLSAPALTLERGAPGEADEADVRAAIERRDWRAAVSLLMERHGDAIHRFCRQMTEDDALAADLLQVTFLQAFVDLQTFSGRSLVRTWLYGIARHRCIDALKARRRWRARFQLADRDETELDAADPAPSAEKRMSRQELVAALEHCLARLAPAVRTALLLRYVEDLPYDEIAGICEERAGTLRTRVARAMPLLRRCVEARGGSAS